MAYKLDIVIPYYNGERTIFRTIDSVLQAIDRSNKILNIEIIVIIDSMDDKFRINNTLNKIYGNRIKVILNNKNLGVSETRNKSISLTNGDYILFLDQDDELDSNYFNIISKYIDKNFDLLLTNGYVKNLRNNKMVYIYYKKPVINKKNILSSNKIITPGQVIFSKRVLSLEKIFIQCSREYKGADDWAAYINLFINIKDINIKYIKNKIFYYNLHNDNYSNNWKELNGSAIATAKYFYNLTSQAERKLLEKRVEFLEFENIYRDDKKYILKNINKFIKYYNYKIKDINRICSIVHKKISGFNKI